MVNLLTDYSTQIYHALSTDARPDAEPGAQLREIDTGKRFIFDGSAWQELPDGGGGGGGADAVLLATVETSEPVNAIRIDFTEEMADYDAFIMEIQGTTSANTMFLCPQINTTGKQIYSGNAKNFHRWYYVSPYNTTNNIQDVSGYGIILGGTNCVVASGPISFFYVKSFYENDTFATGTTMKIWGVKGGIPT